MRSRLSIEVECSSNSSTELQLLIVEEHADLIPQSLGWDRGDVVATNDRGRREPVRHIELHLSRKATNRRRNRRDGDGRQMWAHKLTSENQHRSSLVELRYVYRTHHASVEGTLAACCASPASSASGPVAARISASLSATARRRSRSSARVTTEARLRASPDATALSTNSTSSSGSRTAICLLIPVW
jgi:hypothetical protein